MEELKPCPFCGSSAVLEDCPAQAGGWKQIFWIVCEGEGCRIKGVIGYTAEDAVSAWNRRPPLPKEPA